MSKSVGNVRGLGEVLDEVDAEVLVLFMSTGHYRQPLLFSDEALEDARRSAARIRDAGRRLLAGPSPASLEPHRDAFFAALRNDFNTAEALASLYGWVREANRSEEAVGNSHLVEMLDVLGLVGLLAAEVGPPPRRWRSPNSATRRAARRTGPRPTGCATSCARSVGRSATDPTVPSCSERLEMTWRVHRPFR